ncbi:hypothetical protein ADUPG1_012088 [Aduncisulcus paluster]|uniref:Uncharacterized protein n=1 Tax=Aduncisulcus paluster TaxID=2918883 RepID=A0ABQ5K051_9EUKA|nr:hypothetical protein ADUPG1_012088 [Aduncisulcus paluster]
MEEYNNIISFLFCSHSNLNESLSLFLSHLFDPSILDLSKIFFSEDVFIRLIIPLLENSYFKTHVRCIRFPESIQDKNQSMPESSAFDYNGNRIYSEFPSVFHAPPLCILIDILIKLYELRIYSINESAESDIFSFTSSCHVFGLFCDNYDGNIHSMHEYVGFLKLVKQKLIVQSLDYVTGKVDIFRAVGWDFQKAQGASSPYTRSFRLFRTPEGYIDAPLLLAALSLGISTDQHISRGLGLSYNKPESLSPCQLFPSIDLIKTLSFPPDLDYHLYEAVYSCYIHHRMMTISSTFILSALHEQNRRERVLSTIKLHRQSSMPSIKQSSTHSQSELSDIDIIPGPLNLSLTPTPILPPDSEHLKIDQSKISTSLVSHPTSYLHFISIPSALFFRDLGKFPPKHIILSNQPDLMVEYSNKSSNIISPIKIIDFSFDHYICSTKDEEVEEDIDTFDTANFSKLSIYLFLAPISPPIFSALEVLKNWYSFEKDRFHKFISEERDSCLIEQSEIDVIKAFPDGYIRFLDKYKPFDFVSPIHLFDILSLPQITNNDPEFQDQLDFVKHNEYEWHCLDDISWFYTLNKIFWLLCPILLSKISSDMPTSLYIDNSLSFLRIVEYFLRSCLSSRRRISSLTSYCSIESPNLQYLMDALIGINIQDLNSIYIHYSDLRNYLPILDNHSVKFTCLSSFSFYNFLSCPNDILSLFTICSEIKSLKSIELGSFTIINGFEEEDWKERWKVSYKPEAISEFSVPVFPQTLSSGDFLSMKPWKIHPNSWNFSQFRTIEKLTISDLSITSVSSGLNFFEIIRSFIAQSPNLRYLDISNIFQNVTNISSVYSIQSMIQKYIFEKLPPSLTHLKLLNLAVSPENIDKFLLWSEVNCIKLENICFGKWLTLFDYRISMHVPNPTFPVSQTTQKKIISKLLDFLISVTHAPSDLKFLVLSQCHALDSIAHDSELADRFDILLKQIIPNLEHLSFRDSYHSIEFIRLLCHHLPNATNLIDLDISLEEIDGFGWAPSQETRKEIIMMVCSALLVQERTIRVTIPNIPYKLRLKLRRNSPWLVRFI